MLLVILGMACWITPLENKQALAQEEELPKEEKPLEQPVPPEETPPQGKTGETLQLEEPTLAPPPPEEPLSFGPFTNITIGGLLDYRYIPGPRTATSGSAFLVIHVNELFVSANVGENISILAEQLLITSGRESIVGQDHGFVYATFTNIPLLPSDLSFRLGRFRFKYGIDAVSDAAINPVRTLVYKNLGFIADRGLELSYFWRWFEVSAAVLNGPDEKITSVETPTGPICCLRVGSGNKNRPVAIRGGVDIPNGPKIGLSYFNGKSYPILNLPGFDPETMIFNGELDETKLILKKRYTVDAKYSIWRLDFAGEYTHGTDESVTTQKDVNGYYFRTDVTLVPRKFKWLFQYDLWEDGDLFGPSSDDASFSTAATYNITEESLLRAAYMVNMDDTGVYATVLQILLAF